MANSFTKIDTGNLRISLESLIDPYDLERFVDRFEDLALRDFALDLDIAAGAKVSIGIAAAPGWGATTNVSVALLLLPVA